MKKGILTLFLTALSVASHASQPPGSETIGGPFKGTCKILENGNTIDRFVFDTKPDSKVGMQLDNGGQNGYYFVQVINNSFKNSLSLAVIFVRPVVANPPRFCSTKGGYLDCDYIKPRWSLPPKTAPTESPRLVSLAGSLEIIDSEGMEYGIAEIVDSFQETIAKDNSGFNDRIELKIKGSQTLKCEVSYIDLF